MRRVSLRIITQSLSQSADNGEAKKMWTEIIHLFMHILILLMRFGIINTDELVSKLENYAAGLAK